LAELAEACCLTGDLDRARSELDRSANLQIAHQLEGDLADFSLTRRAKLESRSNVAAARELLRQAKEIQVRLDHRVGEARSWLLEARLVNGEQNGDFRSQAHRRVLEIQSQRPALAQCQLLNRILEHWKEWTTGGMLRDETDYFWHL
jgi:hypothetical protein